MDDGGCFYYNGRAENCLIPLVFFPRLCYNPFIPRKMEGIIMKKLLVAMLLLALCLSLGGCFGGSSSAKPVGDQLASLGFSEKILLPDPQRDVITNDPEGKSGDFLLYTTASFEEVLETVFNACKKASDDDLVRDYMTEEPIEFKFDESAELVWFGYKRGGAFSSVAISKYYDQTLTATPAATEAGTEAATEAGAEAATEAATEAAAEAATEAETEAATEAAEYTIYLLQWG